MNPNKFIALLLVISPLLATASCMSPSKRARKKAVATHLWAEQERIINDQLAEEENKMNSQFKQSKYNQKLAHTSGIHKTATYNTGGIVRHMDLIRE